MDSSAVTGKGQIVIPAKLRKKFGIHPGTRVQFYEAKNEIRLIPITEELIDKNVGFLGTKGELTKLLREEKKKERNL